MAMDFLYEKEIAPCGVAVEMIWGADEKTAKVWKLFAMQIFSEAEGDYRTIGHFDSGAPFLEGIPGRISLSHTSHCLAVASLPKTPDIDLSGLNPRTALGIDLEKADRKQAVGIRERFLSEVELELLPAPADPKNPTDSETERHILAWTCKEALYKAAMGILPDWREDYRIVRLPEIARSIREADSAKTGKAILRIDSEDTDEGSGREKEMEMLLSSWRFEGHIVTLAFSPKIARFARDDE